MIEIKQNESGLKGFFGAFDGDTEAGRISYIYAGKTRMILDHTEVNELYSGQGIGKKILMKIVDFARAKKIEIIPLCPFAKSVFDKTESIRDVLVRF
jgi:predicted GNAT family acetyltransferase